MEGAWLQAVGPDGHVVDQMPHSCCRRRARAFPRPVQLRLTDGSAWPAPPHTSAPYSWGGMLLRGQYRDVIRWAAGLYAGTQAMQLPKNVWETH